MSKINNQDVLKETFCNQCTLQFHTKSVFAVHLSLVHKKKNQTIKEPKPCEKEEKYHLNVIFVKTALSQTVI